MPFRWGMPTRAKEIQDGGSLAGKVSIRLWVISSVIAPSILRKRRASARRFRLRWCDVLGVTIPSLGGRSDRSRTDRFVLPGPQL
jgi:hypothetical protein